MTVDKIPAQYYTHLVYGFAPPISTTTWELQIPGEDEVAKYTTFNGLKKNHPGLITMLSIGGDLPSVMPMSQMAASPEHNQHFVSTTITFIRKYGFDGIDIDWEYPADTSRGGSLTDSASFTNLMSAFRSAIDSESLSPGQSRLLLTAALPGGQYWGQQYNVSSSVIYVDWFNIMAYNVVGVWNSVTNCQSPLENAQNPTGDSVANAVRYFLEEGAKGGATGKQFNLGLSFWGITYTLATSISSTSSPPGIGVPTIGAGTPGTCTQQSGYLSYFEIVSLLKNNSISPSYEKTTECQYFTSSLNQWVGYDDPHTLSDKLSFAASQGLGGASIWGMDADVPGSWDLTSTVSSRVLK